MLKRIVFIFSIVFCASLIGFAQDKTDKVLKDPHQKMEMSKTLKVDSTKIVSKEPWNRVCPVKGEEVGAESPTVEYNGKTYGFCCPGCDAKFEKNPEKYSKNLSEDGTEFIGKK